MQNMIKRIVDADNEAKTLESKNREKLETQKKKIERDSREVYEKYMADARATADKNDVLEELKTEKAWQELVTRQNSIMIKMRSDFENNRDRWIDEIVGRVIESA